MAKVNVVLLGTGRMGKNHLRVIRECSSLFELRAVVDPVAPPPSDLGSIAFARTIDELKVDFDAAVVATPTATHFDVASRIVGMGKHLLLEKPITSTLAQGQQLVATAKANGARLVVGHVERFNPAVRKLRDVLREGWLGTPIHFSFTRVGGYPDTLMKGNNVILDLAVHDIDVLRSLVGRVKFESSMCHATWQAGVLDTAEMLLRCEGGASANLHVNWITPTKIRSIRVTGTKGVCFVDYILQTCELMGGNLLKRIEPAPYEYEAFVEMYRTTDKIAFGVQREEPLRAQLLQFHRFVTTGEAGDLSSGEDALAAVAIAERAVAAGVSADDPTLAWT